MLPARCSRSVRTARGAARQWRRNGAGPQGYPAGVGSEGLRFWPRRLHWRLRGAWLLPTFALMTVADAAIMHSLPPSRTGIRLIPALILAAAGNLFLVGVVAPFLTRRLVARAARSTAGGGEAPPPEVVLDRTASVVLALAAVGLVAAGMASRPLIVSETEDTEANAAAVRDYVLTHGTPEYRRNIDTANTIRLAEGYFRTCVAADDRRRALCLFVDTGSRPPRVRQDASTEPNDRWLGRGDPP